MSVCAVRLRWDGNNGCRRMADSVGVKNAWYHLGHFGWRSARSDLNVGTPFLELNVASISQVAFLSK